ARGRPARPRPRPRKRRRRAAGPVARPVRGRPLGPLRRADALLLQPHSGPRELRMGAMIYEITHTTTYDYRDAVSVSHHVLRLTPRSLSHQLCLAHEVRIHPHPAV